MNAKLSAPNAKLKNLRGLSLLLAALAAVAISNPSAALADSGGLMGQAQPKSYTGKPQGYQGVFPGTTSSYTTASLNGYTNRGYDPNNPYCRPCVKRDLQCKKLQKLYCPGFGKGSLFGNSSGYVGAAPNTYQGSPGGGYGGGVSTSAAGALTYPGGYNATNLGVPFTQGDPGNRVAARYMSAEANYQIQLYQWEVAKKTAEWQAMKEVQIRREMEWNAAMQAKMQAQIDAANQAAQAEEAKKQADAQAAEAPGFAGSFFSIKSNPIMGTEKAEAPAPAVPVVKTQAEVEAAQKPERSAAEKASVLRHFKRSLFGI